MQWLSRKGFYFAIVVWSVLVLASLLSQRERMNETALALARIDAIANLRKDMAIREWAAKVGGVYIREEAVPPFNALEEEQRVTVSRDGQEQFRLIRVTPMHLLLAIQETSNETFGLEERLTSKQLRNIDNAPDNWEEQALEALNKGDDTAVEVVSGRGHGLMRVMIPMRMEEECLECHRDTLVPIGGLRGGATISINLNSYRTAQEPAWRAIQYWHFSIWVLGFLGLCIFRFFSKRRALEISRQMETQHENEAAFSAMAEGTMMTDGDATILWVNEAFMRMSGFRHEEIIGRNASFFMAEMRSGALADTRWWQLCGSGHWRGELWGKKRSGELFPVEVSIQALCDKAGRPRRYISIFSDITERKQHEQALSEYQNSLEDQVRQRTEELTVARNQAESANKSKSIFLANMNHELRTPLNAVIGFSQLMEKDLTLSQKLRRNLEIINASGRHLLTLIDDILEVSKIESGKIEVLPEDVAPVALFEQIIDMVRLRAEQSGLALTLETGNLPPVVSLDPVMIRQVLLNLLSNAIKFTPSGQIVLRVTGEHVASGLRLDFSVQDSGIGIAPEDRERIFSSFEQVVHAQHGGTGLGLTISRQYVHMLGGELKVASALGKGTLFYFSTVVETRHTLVAQKPEALTVLGLAGENQTRHILLVDDISEARLLVKSLLEPLGLRVSETDSLAEAERIVETDCPDLIVIDWFFPDGSGIEFLKKVRENHALSKQPRLIMLTANALEESRKSALAAGADAFLSKPFQSHEFYRVLEPLLHLHFQWGSGVQEMPRKEESHQQTLASELAALPSEMREKLVQAAISLSPLRIATALQQLAAEKPELAATLEIMSSGRQYRALWEALAILETEE